MTYKAGLGTSATKDVGINANNVVQLDESSRLPAVDGSQLTNTTGLSNVEITANIGINDVAEAIYFTSPTTSSSYTIELPDRFVSPTQSANLRGKRIVIHNQSSQTLDIIAKIGRCLNCPDGQGGYATFYNKLYDLDGNLPIHNNTTNTYTVTLPAETSAVLVMDYVGSYTSEWRLYDFASGISALSQDNAPVLGGDLDVSTYDIKSISNNNIELTPNGTGSTVIKGNTTGGSGHIVLNCEQNSHGITLKSPPHSANANYTLTLPNDTGNANEVLKTDGNGNLDWIAQSSGGYTYSAITATTTAQIEYHYSCGAGDETFTLNLPAVTGGDAGKEIRVKNMGTGTITIDGNSSSTIDGQQTITLDVQFSSITLVATGNAPASWEIV